MLCRALLAHCFPPLVRHEPLTAYLSMLTGTSNFAGALIAFFFLDETLSPAQRLQPEPKAIEVVRGRSHYGAHTSSTVPVPVDSDAEDACSIAVRDENELASEHWLKTLFTSRRVQSALLVYVSFRRAAEHARREC